MAMSAVLIFLIQALIVVFVPLAISRGLRLKSMLPLVVVQIIVGIALGPSVFGRIAPDAFNLLFNPATLKPLAGIASIAVLLFGFTIGMHLDFASFRGRGRGFSFIAAASVAVPSLSGILAGLWIAARFPEEVGSHVTAGQVATAIGICTGVTALPVLGAILREMNLLGQRLGQIALGIAAVNDLVLWVYLGTLLALVFGQRGDGPGLLATIIVLPFYLLLMGWVLRPLLNRVVTKKLIDGKLGESAVMVVCAVAIGSSVITEAIGLHYVLGVVVAGAIMPPQLRAPILDRLQVVTIGVLMPFFFILTGLRTMIDLGSPAFLEVFFVITVLAILGKMGGTAVVARLVGESWPTAIALGSLVQTKGLTEVITLTILLEAGVITGNVFAALILMAVISTALVMPVTRFALACGGRQREDARLAEVIGASLERAGSRPTATAASIRSRTRPPLGGDTGEGVRARIQ